MRAEGEGRWVGSNKLVELKKKKEDEICTIIEGIPLDP